MSGQQKNIAIAVVCAALLVFVVATSDLSISQVATAAMIVLIPIAVGALGGVFGLVPFVKSADERARDRAKKKEGDQ